MSKRFERMCRQSLASEILVRDFLHLKYPLQFHITPHEQQNAMGSKGIHVADILCVEKPHVAFEVKEDIKSGVTGNLAFEISGMQNLRRWGHGAGIQHIYLMYVNHKDFCLEVVELGMYSAQLDLELKALSERDKRCRIVAGGDQFHPIYIVPIHLARKLDSCRSTKFFNDVDMFLFSKTAKIRLQR